MSNIIFKEVDISNYDECIALEVSSNQKEFVVSNKEALNTYEQTGSGIEPVAIYADDLLVGFAMFRNDTYYKCFFIWYLMIDAKYQNKGYGRQSIIKLLELFRLRNSYKRVTISVSEENEKALSLYKSVGFKIVEDFEGEVDLEYNI